MGLKSRALAVAVDVTARTRTNSPQSLGSPFRPVFVEPPLVLELGLELASCGLDERALPKQGPRAGWPGGREREGEKGEVSGGWIIAMVFIVADKLAPSSWAEIV